MSSRTYRRASPPACLRARSTWPGNANSVLRREHRLPPSHLQPNSFSGRKRKLECTHPRRFTFIASQRSSKTCHRLMSALDLKAAGSENCCYFQSRRKWFTGALAAPPSRTIKGESRLMRDLEGKIHDVAGSGRSRINRL